jgi:hypothetical protein
MSHGDPERLFVLSQDYELFFQNSGSVEKCLFEPTGALLAFAERTGARFTFFVDAGMLCCYDRHARQDSRLRQDAAKIRRDLERISSAGHELGLHVHPHWEDTRLVDGRWDFSRTRYQLRDFSDEEVAGVIRSYFECLQSLSSAPVTAYRAGGFCVEPFARIADTLSGLGVTIESSVVPGASLADPDKGFDFSRVPDEPYWFFERSPLAPADASPFVELPITPYTVSRGFYWKRLGERLRKSPPADRYGDGVSKAIGRREVARRLLGRSRTSELSIDAAKADDLLRAGATGAARRIWHVMGHPKLLSSKSLAAVERFVTTVGPLRYDTVAGAAREARAGLFA